MNIVDADLKRREDDGVPFDYKKDLKSPTKIAELRSIVIPQYQMAIRAKFARPFSIEWQESRTIFASLSSSAASNGGP